MGRSRRTLVVAVAVAVTAGVSACGGTTPARHSPAAARPVLTTASATPSPSSSPTPTGRAASQLRSSHAHASTQHVAAKLPLRFTTGTATQLVTVTAPTTSSTEGTLQAWRKVAGEWRKLGTAMHAWLGSDGLSTQPSETRSATPIGSFTLTRAFGHDADPGTTLPYVRTTPGDWWISQPGPLYNTRQRCTSDCSFTLGDPNEHLYYETPYYNYALVIDYNTRNAPGGVRQGAGSAFFLHVSVGKPTAGCISIAQDRLAALLRWLTPRAHPRILIGTA